MKQWNDAIASCCYPKQMVRLGLHRGPTPYDILPKLNNAKYMSIIDASSGYYNLQLHTKSSYLTNIHMSIWQVPV